MTLRPFDTLRVVVSLFEPRLASLAQGGAAAAVLFLGGTARAEGGYERELGVRLMFGASQPRMFAVRQAIRDGNAVQLAAGSWTGGVSYGSLAQALGGGLEVSWGATPDLRLVAALEGRGTQAAGGFDGTGVNAVTDPILGLQRQRLDRTARYPAFGQEAGLTALLRDLGLARVGFHLRVGIWELADAREEEEESGPIRSASWLRRLSGTAPSAYLGVEWEWTPGPVGVFAAAGYRELVFKDVAYRFGDSAGAKSSGDYKFADGTRVKLDFSGPEMRFGVQALFSIPPPLN